MQGTGGATALRLGCIWNRYTIWPSYSLQERSGPSGDWPGQSRHNHYKYAVLFRSHHQHHHTISRPSIKSTNITPSLPTIQPTIPSHTPRRQTQWASSRKQSSSAAQSQSTNTLSTNINAKKPSNTKTNTTATAEDPSMGLKVRQLR